ncbi:NADPH oxidase activator 1 [Lacerta agilis]|uniref:NADPH oxidase activator 1 n=1 Tax=Lacerta agilis TaxID=80427 RepID=UPI00141A58F5|nr:NADPH oxidase activator 1 [Lacerta agilis]
MAYSNLVRYWNKGVLALEKGSWESALRIFCSIENPPSKINFNIGCLHLARGDLQQALEAFDQSISKDNCLAVGFFQRGHAYLLLERYEEALNDFRLALLHLRKNPCIDYKQLGLKFVLCAWEVAYNTAAAHCLLGQWQDAQQALKEAARETPKGQIHHLDSALKQVQEHLFLEPRSVPQGEIFKPPKKDVEELEEKDFLGQAKVISSAFEEDCGIGFHGPEPQVKGGKQGKYGGYSRFCSHPKPKRVATFFVCVRTRDLAYLKASHFLQKGSSGIPPPPGKAPPTLPCERQNIQKSAPVKEDDGRADMNITGQNRSLEDLSSSGEAGDITNGFILLKIHTSYSVKVKMSPAPSLADFRNLLQEECCQQATRVSVRYKISGSDELIPVSNDEELRNIWQSMEGGQLTLWCQAQRDTTSRPVLYHMIACHPYTAQGQEDLSFKEGDKLEILSEVNEEWLEGRCNGTTGIFPKCFAVRECC